jgi:hypothetical protein
MFSLRAMWLAGNPVMKDSSKYLKQMQKKQKTFPEDEIDQSASVIIFTVFLVLKRTN